MEADDASDNTRNGRIRRNNPLCDLIGQSQEKLAVVIHGISQQEQVDVDPWSALNQREAARIMASRRTVYRLLQTLSMTGVPWYFDETARAYRVRPGFRFPDIEQAKQRPADLGADRLDLKPVFDQLIHDGKKFAATLDSFLQSLEELRQDR